MIEANKAVITIEAMMPMSVVKFGLVQFVKLSSKAELSVTVYSVL